MITLSKTISLVSSLTRPDIHYICALFSDRDAEDELDWIREKEPLASSTNRGRDLIGVQNLIKKHQALQSELDSKQSRINDVIRAGEGMIDREHFASPDIKQKVCLLAASSYRTP